MSGAKIKNLIILILALTVVFLLVLVVPLRMSQSWAEQAQHAQIAELYAGYDVQLDSAALPTSVTLYTIELGAGGEQTAAAALLGGSAQLQADATRYAAAYTAPTGRCEFSRAGGFYAALTGGEQTSDVQKHAERLLREMGYQAFSLSASGGADEDEQQITATQSLLGVPVFGETLTLRYTGGVLTQMSGTFFTGGENITRVSEDACISCADALIALLGSRDRLGWVGSRIDRVQQGYVYTETAAGTLRFVPGWCIDTDTGAFFVSGATREVRPME